ncbi:MAG: acyl-CoA dehydrogenase family protein [Paraburkholderia sp.]|jgi:butyryl-CoA dehydrogenase
MHEAQQAIQIHCGNGVMSEYPVARAFGDAKVLEIVDGTSEIQRMIISREVMKYASSSSLGPDFPTEPQLTH